MSIFRQDTAAPETGPPEDAATSWLSRLGLAVASPPAIDKAGIVVHGMLAYDPLTHAQLKTPTHYVVAPWSQGRFSDDNTKLYFLAKGSVDHGESALQAAMRESYEETGINAGAIDQGLIPGVQACDDRKMPLERAILGSSGHPWQTQIFPLQVTGIDRLVPFLKNPQAQVEGGFASTVAEKSQPYARDKNLPTFEEMRHWLRSGIMPDARWNHRRGRDGSTLATRGTFEALEQRVMGELIAARTAKNAEGKPVLPGRAVGDDAPEIKNPTEFGIFRDALNRKDCEWLDTRLKQMKQMLTDYNVISDDFAPVKIDMKERPLQFYQEGADLIPMSEYITRIVQQALINKRYDRNMLGAITETSFKHGPNHHVIDAIARKEIAMLAPAIYPQDIEDAEIPSNLKFALKAIVRGYTPDQKEQSR